MTSDDKPRTVYWLDNKLYLNITNKCSNRCIFCFRNFKQGLGDFILKLDHEPTMEEIINELEGAMKKRVWKEIVFCGFGEPTERLDLLLMITRWIKSRYGSIMIRLNTNGHGIVLNKGRDVVAELKTAGLDKVSISLNAANEETYNEICKPTFSGAYSAILEFIEKAKSVLNVEVTAVTTPEVDLHEVETLAKQMNVKFRLRPCVPCFW